MYRTKIIKEDHPMKKVLALLMTLVLTLSCVGALAEEATTTKATLSVNGDMLAMLAGLTDAEDQQLLNTILAVVNNLGLTAVEAEGASQLTLTLKDAPVSSTTLTFGDEGSMVMVSDLFPSHAITLSAADLSQFMGSMPSEEEITALVSSLEAPMAAFMEGFLSHATAPVTGEYEFEGAAFNAMVTIDMTMDEMKILVLNLVKSLMENPTTASLFASMGDINVAEIDEELKDLAEADPEDTVPLNIALYNNEAEGNVYITLNVADEDMTFSVAGGLVNGTFSLHLVAGESIYTSVEEMRQAAMVGSGDVMVFDWVIAIDEAMETLNATMDMIFQGVSLRLAIDLSASAIKMDLYFMTTDAPILSINLMVDNGGEIVPVTTEGKTVINFMELANDAEGALSSALLMDVMSFGLNNLIANAAAAMPDEVSALVMLLSGPSATQSTTQVEGIAQ